MLRVDCTYANVRQAGTVGIYCCCCLCACVTFCPFVMSFCLIRTPLNHSLLVSTANRTACCSSHSPERCARTPRADCQQTQVGEFVYARAACAPAKKDNKFKIRKLCLFMCRCCWLTVVVVVAAATALASPQFYFCRSCICVCV